MKKNFLLTIISCVVFILTSSVTASALPDKVEDGVMLHCHGWPFAAIEANLDQIAAAGFNSIQVSPVQKIRAPKSNETSSYQPTGPWWLFYQPVSFRTIGNYKLGTADDFRSLCDEAGKRGIKIIVDLVFNHVADTGTPVDVDEQLDIELRDPSLYHDNGKIDNYQDRWQVTQKNLGGLPDLITQDQRIQDMHVYFLNRCVAAGADGFRFDAAKHIETSRGEDEGWAGDYWEDVLHRINNRANLYLFGEVLQDRGDNMDVYVSYYDVTAHNYGSVLRSAVQNRRLMDLQNHIDTLAGIGRNAALAYVENHDDYEHGKSRNMNFQERKFANVFLIARAGLVPRVMDRPEDDIWSDPDIAAVIHFRNAVTGTEEYLRFPSQDIAIVERGKKAVAIINLGHDVQLDVKTGLEGGTYDNRATRQCQLEVSGGRLKGTLPGGVIFVAYAGGGTVPTVETVFKATYDTGWGHDLYIRGNTAPLSWSKGIKMNWTDGNVWVWKTTRYPQDTEVEFKVLIDDRRWEIIDGMPLNNHKAASGSVVSIVPQFP